jgi:hypothetical protein
VSISLSQVNQDSFTGRGSYPENPLSDSGAWSGDTHGDAQLQVASSGICEPSTAGAICASLFTGGTAVGNDQYASITIGTSGGSGTLSYQASARFTDNGISYGANAGYMLQLSFNPSTGDAILTVVAAANPLFFFTGSLYVGDVITVAAVGSRIYVLQNSTIIREVTNTTYTSGITTAAIQSNVSVANAQITNFANGNAAQSGTYSINGTVQSGSPGVGIPGVTITLGGAASGTTTTDSNGNYNFTGLANGSYTIAASGLSASYGLDIGTLTPVINNADSTGTIINAYWSISGNAGVAGATVTAVGAAFGNEGSVTADGSGNFVLSRANGVSLQNDTWTITPTLTNYSFSPMSRNEVMSSANITGVNFSATLLGYAVSGNAGAPGALISYTGTSSGTTTADGSGNWSVSGLANGTYTFTPSLAKWTFTPTSKVVTVNNAAVTGVNFTASNVYSQPDARNYGNFPNDGVVVQGTIQYTVPSVFSLRYWFDKLFNRTQPLPLDSRTSAPTDSRNGDNAAAPQNSRAPGTYGPGE